MTLLLCGGQDLHARTSPTFTSAAYAVEDIEKRWSQLTEPQRLSAVSQLIRNGNLEAAERILPHVEASTVPGRKVMRLLRAKLLREQGRLTDAASTLDTLVAEDPYFTSARLDLAQILLQQKQETAARRQFEFLLGSTMSSEQKEAIRHYISTIDDSRSWNLSAFTGLSASTNLNQSNETISTKPGAGIGGVAGILGGWRAPVRDNLDFMFAASAVSIGYTQSTFDDVALSVEAGPRLRFDWGHTGLYATVGQHWTGDGTHAFSYGARLASFFKFTDQERIGVSAPCAVTVNAPTSDRDGWTCGLQANIDHAFSGQSFARLLTGIERQHTHEADLGYWGRSIGLGFGHDIVDNLSVYGQFLYTWRDYDGLDGPANLQRRDHRLDLSVQLSSRIWEAYGMTPSLRYNFTHNQSNIDNRAFEAHGVSLTLTKKF